MRLPLIYKIVAPFLLVIFTITSCDVFVMPEPDTVSVPIGKGDIRFFYLDENNQPTINDIGRMAMYVENNELTKDVMVLAELPNDNIDNDIVVRVINKQNNSLVSFFYFRGQYFPHKTVVTIDGENIIGNFSLYNPLSGTYSVEFTYKDGESENYNDFILNKNVFTAYKEDNALTETQNVRIQRIITTLALWNSLAFQMDEDFQVGGRGFWDWLKKPSSIITLVFAAVAIVALAVVVVAAPPASFAVVDGLLTVSAATTTQAVAVGISGGASVLAFFTQAFADVIDNAFGYEEQKPPPPNSDSRPQILITLNGTVIENNNTPFYYLNYDPAAKKGESLTFNIKVTDYGSPNAINISDNVNLINWFDPDTEKYIDKNSNQLFFLVNKENNINNIYPITVERIKEGYIGDGKIKLVLKFGRDVIINKKSGGIDFYDDNNNPVKGIKDRFVINLTVKAL